MPRAPRAPPPLKKGIRMLTYVINTSENKTFDSSMLFELAGYNKIRWMQTPLDEIGKCAEDIYEKQNILGADRFRIAVIVDFYNFDRVRIPYGRRGFSSDNGVELCLYMPYIEVFLLDNLIAYLEKKGLFAADFEVYYVQDEKSEHYDLFESAKDQLSTIMKGGLPAPAEDGTADGLFRTFKLYCTAGVTLEFDLESYPYGATEMTFDQFWTAFRARHAIKVDMRRHYYLTSYGGGSARAALDTLSLSLYLIHTYEREEEISEEGDMEVLHLDPTVLKEVLECAWSKINLAKSVAKRSNINYYSLEQTKSPTALPENENADSDDATISERVSLPKEIVDTHLSAEGLYNEICDFAGRTSDQISTGRKTEFNKIMSEYLKTRDSTREADIEEEFLALRLSGFLETTDQCPSKEEYGRLVQSKEGEISQMFEKALAAEYIEVDYSQEKEKADAAYAEYKKLKACLRKNLFGDIIFMLLSVAAMLIPYYTLQLSFYAGGFFAPWILGLICAGVFAALFAFAMVLQVLPLTQKLRKAKNKLYNCYLDCHAKERHSFSAIRRRYEKDLIYIEHARYEIRQLKHIYDANMSKHRTVMMHRELLDRIEDCLSSILNNLDVEPMVDPLDSIDGEFDLTKSLHAKENKVYQIFSIETIEKMFPKRGGEMK